MTGKSDWADERASVLWSLDNWQSDLANELRKAKSDGMREAAKLLEACGECDSVDHIDEIREAASKLDPPTD